MKKNIQVIQTARDTDDRLTEKEPVLFGNEDPECELSIINIYTDVEYQDIEGFGGAFTEAGADTLYRMSPEKRQEILNAYFNPVTGLGYSLCRTHINSCDFSLENYSYVEKEGDVELETFSIDRDKKYLVPFIKDALQVRGAEFKLFASPWSPPAWMKTNGEMNFGGKVKEEYRQVWAQYFVRYLRAYASEGINLWGLTVQNEPIATQTWDSCIYTAEEERDFVKNHLGPLLKKEGLQDIKIMVWDQNKERIYERAKIVLSDPEAAGYIWGTAFHWYAGDHFEALSAVRHIFPDKKLLFTEGCRDSSFILGTWDTGEYYGHSIIGDINHWSAGWTDWNLVLNREGGPNHVGNYCDAPIIADTETDTVYYESSYYYIGHFSKFVRPGARRIAFSRFDDSLEVTAFKNPDGKVVVIVMNRGDRDIEYKLRCEHGIADMSSRSHSITTLIYGA